MKIIETPTNPACEVDRELDKHVALYRAIRRVNKINERLEDLVARIEGREITLEDSVKDSVKDSTPPLLEVLNDGADEIHRKIDEAQQRIEHLNTLLF